MKISRTLRENWPEGMVSSIHQGQKSIFYVKEIDNIQHIFITKDFRTNLSQENSIFNSRKLGGRVKIVSITPSFSEDYLIIRISDQGADFHSLKVLNILNNEIVPELEIQNIRISNLEWSCNDKSFILTTTEKNNKAWKFDILQVSPLTREITSLYSIVREKPVALFAYWHGPSSLILNEMNSTRNNSIMFLNLGSNRVSQIDDPFLFKIVFLGTLNNTCYFLVNKNNENSSLMMWKSKDDLNLKLLNNFDNLNITDATLYNHELLAIDSSEIHSRLLTIPINIENATPKLLFNPKEASTFFITRAARDINKLIVTGTSFTERQSFYIVNKNNSVKKIESKNTQFRFSVKQCFAEHSDGIKIPYYLITSKSNENKSCPTLLRAYGGFGAISSPRYFHENIEWVRNGGNVVVANVRGGGEFGQYWHEQGKGANKKQSIADLILVAEKLISSKLTKPSRLALYGNSHGGFLTCAAALDRPELFRALIADRALLNLLKIKDESSGWAWINEFGDPDITEVNKQLNLISPLQCLKKNNSIDTLLISSESDERVSIAQSIEYLLKFRSISNKDIYLRTTQGSGHGTGRFRADFIAEKSVTLAFLTSKLGIPWTL